MFFSTFECIAVLVDIAVLCSSDWWHSISAR